jgi:ribosome maturation factor RimP
MLKSALLLDDCQKWVNEERPTSFIKKENQNPNGLKTLRSMLSGMKRPASPSMQPKPEQVKAIQEAVFPLVESQLDPRYFLVDAVFEKEAGYWYLRVYADLKEGSISISECEAISRSLDPVLETFPLLADVAYSLEVSSPGLFRPLKTVREFTFYQGEPVRITGSIESKNKKKAAKALPSELPTVAEGILTGFDETRKVVTLRDSKTTKDFEVCLQDEQAVYLNPVIRFPEEEDHASLSSAIDPL